jgi:hypothetical protein
MGENSTSEPENRPVPALFLEREGSLPCSEGPASGPYPKSVECTESFEDAVTHGLDFVHSSCLPKPLLFGNDFSSVVAASK